jgi:hypothetical protein
VTRPADTPKGVDGVNTHAAKDVGFARDTADITEDTWNTRDLQVLRAVVDAYDETGTYLTRATAVGRPRFRTSGSMSPRIGAY